MSDIGNVYVSSEYSEREGVYLYSHWGGKHLPGVVQSAMRRGMDRWNDAQYLARILFCEMIKDDVMGTRDFGISSHKWSGDRPILVVDCVGQLIKLCEKDGDPFYDSTVLCTFREFVDAEYPASELIEKLIEDRDRKESEDNQNEGVPA